MTEGSPGFAIAVIRQGKLIYRKGYGLADIKSGQSIDVDSSFRLASVSKQFTAMAIAMLAERGKLKYEDDITLYLEQLPRKGVTIQHLIYHTSGLPDYMDMVTQHWRKEQRPVNKDLINLFSKHKPKLYFRPGDKYEYCNTGYMLLASIIEKVSGQTLAEFMRENIFKPLKMEHSQIWSPDAKLHKRVLGYSKKTKTGEFQVDDENILNNIYGDGGIYATVSDMANWAIALDGNKLVNEKTRKHIFSTGHLNNGKRIDYGFGWRVEPGGNDAEPLIWHSGGWLGFSSYIVIYPARDLKIIVLSNNSGLKTYEMTEKIDKLYP